MLYVICQIRCLEKQNREHQFCEKKPIASHVFAPFMLGGNVSKEIVSSRNARYVSQNFTNLEIPASKTLW